jgi:hypothetical protein
MDERKLFLSDVDRMMENVREYLLAGGSAALINDDVRNKGCAYASAEDLRFLFGEEYGEALETLRLKITDYCQESMVKKEPDTSGIEKFYADFMERLKMNKKIGALLKSILYKRIEFGVENLPRIFKSTPEGGAD